MLNEPWFPYMCACVCAQAYTPAPLPLLRWYISSQISLLLWVFAFGFFSCDAPVQEKLAILYTFYPVNLSVVSLFHRAS